MKKSTKTIIKVSAVRLSILIVGAISMFLAFNYDLSHADMTDAMKMIIKLLLLATSIGAITLALVPKFKTIKYLLGQE